METIICGAQRTNEYLPLLAGKKVAVVVNQTSNIGTTHLVDSLLKLDVSISKIFAPEHGFRGEADAGAHVENGIDVSTNIPIISIYGKNKKPSKEQLTDVDFVIFDIQDVGCRFYTYISSLHYVMEACAESNIPLVVLDRPNPNAHYVDGPILKKEFSSFVGMHEVPVVYGMTIGEYAQMINGESWLANGVKCKLKVIPLLNYNHSMPYELPTNPSPNLPNYRSVLLYPSLCLFEGTIMSVGRGTDKQFQVIGHPNVKSDFSFTPSPIKGASDPFLNGVKCYGIDLSNLNIDQLFTSKRLDISHLINYYRELKDTNGGFFLKNLFFDKLAGTDELRLQIMKGMSKEQIQSSWKSGLENFMAVRSKYLLYKDEQ